MPEVPVETFFGTARFDEEAGVWTGIIAGRDFIAYWERGYVSGECEFVVEIDGEEVSRRGCGEVDCRNSNGSAEILEYEGRSVLEWERRESFPLRYVKNNEGCVDFFCGTCECTCRELCVSIRATAGEGESAFFLEGSGEIGLDPYLTDCLRLPVWTGTITTSVGALVEDIYVEVRLVRDPYDGSCWLEGTARGQELTPHKVTDCKTLGNTWELYDGSIIVAKCKECDCVSSEVCEFCCLPLDFSQPEYPGGVLRDIPFELTGCGDPISGNFATAPGNIPCTEESLYYGATWNTPSQAMYVNGPALPDGSCPTTPCFNTFTTVLECTARFSEEGDDSACDRLWLWIGSGNQLIGDDGSTPPASPGIGFVSWIKLRATSCTCDEVGGVSAIFEFDITIDCSDKPFGDEYGPCAGLRIDCCEYTCSGTLVI